MWATKLWAYRLASAQGQLEAHETTDIFETIETIGPSTSWNDPTGIPRVSFYGTPNVTGLKNVTVTKTALRPKSTWLSSVLVDESKNPGNSSVPKQPLCHLDGNACGYFWAGWFTIQMYAKRMMVFAGSVDDFVPSACFSRNLSGSNSTKDCLSPETCPAIRSCDMTTEGEVLLLYFPPEFNGSDTAVGKTAPKFQLAQRNVTGIPYKLGNGTRGIFSTTALTFRGQDLYHRARITDGTTYTLPRTFVNASTMYGNWTFTSPFMVKQLKSRYVRSYCSPAAVRGTPPTHSTNGGHAFKANQEQLHSAGVHVSPSWSGC